MLRPVLFLAFAFVAIANPGDRSPAQQQSGIIWSADHETGDLSQWTANGRGGSYDSGKCIRPADGVTTELSHSGRYSMKITIDTSLESGCRQFRSEEAISGSDLFYSAWFYVPQFHAAKNYWNIFQFKSKTQTKNDPFWVIDLLPREDNKRFALRLRWKGATAGPKASDGIAPERYPQEIIDFPIGRWVHLEAFLKQSSQFGGQLTVWQDGVEVWNLQGIKTKYAEGENRWSVNNYSDSLEPSPATLYIDDAVVATERVGPR
jgi:hypothetical protein